MVAPWSTDFIMEKRRSMEISSPVTTKVQERMFGIWICVGDSLGFARGVDWTSERVGIEMTSRL